MHRTFTTNLRCGGCLNSVRPLLDAQTDWRWSVDLSAAGKPITVEAENFEYARLVELFRQAGYEITGEVIAPTVRANGESKLSYFPLLLIFAYLAGTVLLFEVTAGAWDTHRAMSHFMAGFFLIFSFFKLLNLSAFADSFAMYDLLASRSRGFALAYPFIELALGIAYLTRFAPVWTNALTIGVMGIGTVGVLNTLWAGRKVRCACLGTVFNLPMSSVTLIEDLLMLGMAAAMLAM